MIQIHFRNGLTQNSAIFRFVLLLIYTALSLSPQGNCAKCLLDPHPTELLKASLDDLLPILTTICNWTLLEGVLLISQKIAISTPILKKAGLNPDVAANYRPIFNLTFISKDIECIVTSQLTAYLFANNLLSTRQSVYRVHHSTETAIMGITSIIFDIDSYSYLSTGPYANNLMRRRTLCSSHCLIWCAARFCAWTTALCSIY